MNNFLCMYKQEKTLSMCFKGLITPGNGIWISLVREPFTCILVFILIDLQTKFCSFCIIKSFWEVFEQKIYSGSVANLIGLPLKLPEEIQGFSIQLCVTVWVLQADVLNVSFLCWKVDRIHYIGWVSSARCSTVLHCNVITVHCNVNSTTQLEFDSQGENLCVTLSLFFPMSKQLYLDFWYVLMFMNNYINMIKSH